MARTQVRFQIYTSGSSAVQYTFDETRLERGYEWAIGGQDVRPLEGRAESQQWPVDVVDYSSGVTSILSDTSGRANLLGRLADFAINLDSSGWRTLGTGRLSDIQLKENVGAYRFLMDDELFLARNSLIFTQTTTVYIYPPGLQSTFMNFRPRQLGGANVVGKESNLVLVHFDAVAPISRSIWEEIRKDLTAQQFYHTNSTQGNFQFLRFNSCGLDFEVWGMGDSPAPSYVLQVLDEQPLIMPVRVWVVDPSANLTTASSGQIFPGNEIRLTRAHLHMNSARPSPTRPKHIGGEFGTHPFQLVKDIWDGTYGDATIRYDSTALNSLITNTFYPSMWWRITEPVVMEEWLEDHIFKPFGVVPFVNADGRIEPYAVFLPSSDVADVSTLFAFTSTNLRTPHPTWLQTKRELCTVVDYEQQIVHSVGTEDFPADLLAVKSWTTEFVNDRVATLGRHLSEITYGGGIVADSYQQLILAPALARETFDRFGDGPIWGRLHALSSGTSGVTPGQFVSIGLATYPNVGLQGRGGSRVVQIMSKTNTPYGPDFDYLNAATTDAPLASPTLTVTTSGLSPLHSLVATIGGIPSSAASVGTTSPIIRMDGGWQLEFANAASTLASNSTAWQPVASSNSSGAFEITRLKSGSTYWGRVRATRSNRFRSAWVYTTSGVATQELTGPTGLAATGHTISTIDLSWTNSTASTGYNPEMLASTFGGTLTSTALLPPGSDRYRMWNLSSGTTYTFGVRYRDPYGGVSPSTTLSTETTGASSGAGSISGFHLIYGNESTGVVYY